MKTKDAFKELLLQFLHTAQDCIEACLVEETKLVDDPEKFGLMYWGAPDLFKQIHTLKDQYKGLPEYVGSTPVFTIKGLYEVGEIMQDINDLPILTKSMLLQLYLKTLCVAIECKAITLTELSTSYIESMSQFHWKNRGIPDS